MFLCVSKNRCGVRYVFLYSKNSDDDDDEDAEIRSHFLASCNAVSGVRECAGY